MFASLWKDNWEETRQHFLDWWDRKGLVIGMWENLELDGLQHELVPPVAPATDMNQYWFDPEWRSAHIHYSLSRSSFKADILPVANTHLGPGSLSAILGGNLIGYDDAIWIHARDEDSDEVVLDENNSWWKLHMDLIKACKCYATDRYFVGCPDLIEGLDTLAGLRGVTQVMLDIAERPEELERQLRAANEAWFEVFEKIYQEINIDGEMAFCYFSLWAPGRMAKLQCDVSAMISPRAFRRFVVPYITEQCQRLDYSLYHLDGVDAIRHLNAILEIEELDAVQWTPGVNQPQGGDPTWFDLYHRVLDAGKSVMPSLVEVDELQPLLDEIGPAGVNAMVTFKTEQDVETAVRIAEQYR